MIWDEILGSEMVGPFRVPEGVKVTSKRYVEFLTDHFLPCYKKKNCASLKGRSMKVGGGIPQNDSSGRQYWHAQLKFKQKLYRDLQVQWMRELLKLSQRRAHILICNLNCK